MFCYKCGTENPDDVAFCHRCGAKIADADVERPAQTSSEPISAAAPNPVPPRQREASALHAQEQKSFEKYLEESVRSTTGCRSAKELLNKKVPLKFARLSFGIPIGLALLLCIFSSSAEAGGVIAALFFALLIGWLAARVSGGIAKGKLSGTYSGKFSRELDTDDLIRFLNTHLEYLYPYFHDWDYLKTTWVGYGLAGAAVAGINEAISEGSQEITLGTEFGEGEKIIFSKIIIRPDPTSRSGGKEYFFEADSKKGGHALFSTYRCLVKTAPILQAAMEYYLCQSEENE